ncbi:MAG: VWA domain-containing protein [Planctomycetota bacterium]|nr:VWA domain-containing protein [Planctomycetota bacterium]
MSGALPIWLLVVLSAGALPAQDAERRAIAALRRALSPKSQASPEDRLAAVARMQGLDGPAVARALARAHGWLDHRIAAIEAQRLEILHRLYAMRFDPKEKIKVAGRARGPVLKRARRDANQTRAVLDEVREVKLALEAQVRALNGPKALTWLARSVVAGKRAAVALRVAAAQALGSSDDPGHALLAGILDNDKEAAPIAAALAGVAARGPGPAFVRRATALLRHRVSVVRDRAARALAVSCVADAIPALIDLLAVSAGQQRARVIGMLEGMTRQKHGGSLAAWRGWFADNEEDLRSGAIELGPKPPTKRKGGGKGKREQEGRSMLPRKEPGPTYMGIPMDGDAIVFVLDASSSMNAEVDFALPGVTRAGGAEPTRLDASQAELIRALNLLTPSVRFNVLYFHESVGRFREVMVLATRENVALARTFVRSVKPRFATNIHDAMQRAFSLLDPERSKRPLGDGVDTMFLLTDGRPYLQNAGKGGIRDKWPKILAACLDWDPLRRVTVHCIGIGKGIAKRPLRKLAEAFGGTARFY